MLQADKTTEAIEPTIQASDQIEGYVEELVEVKDEDIIKGKVFADIFNGTSNQAPEKIHAQLRKNLKAQLPQLDVHPVIDDEVAFLCGGPSLNNAEIPKHCKIATCNGTHQWALDHGLKPSIHIMLDSRQFNVRFVENPIESCFYMLCSQIHPDVIKALEGYKVFLFHGANGDMPEKKILDRHYMGRWRNISGGSSVGTRGIGVLHAMGVRKIRIFGMDGCLVDGNHHAFDQPENDGMSVQVVNVNGRRFRAHTWMIGQLDDFLRMVPHIPDDLELAIEGDGMIAFMLSECFRTNEAPKVVLETR